MPVFHTFASVSALRQILTFALSAWLLVATVGVTINKHYCMGRLQSVAMNIKAHACEGMEEEEEERMPCCHDTSDRYVVDDDRHLSDNEICLKPCYCLLAITPHLPAYLKSIDTAGKDPKFAHYKPPLITTDIPVLVQTFLL